MRYAMVLWDTVIDVITEDTAPQYPPDQWGNSVAAVECEEWVKIGMAYDSQTGTFKPPTDNGNYLSEQEEAILETAVNVDYLVCLADLGL